MFLNDYLDKKFKPQIRKKCRELKLKKCKVADKKWNHASFAAYMTYEVKTDVIEALANKKKLEPKQYFTFLQDEYKKFEELEEKTTFFKYLENL